MKNLLLLFLTITLLYACKTKDTATPNRPPNAFVVTPTLKTDGKTIVLNWTKAKDPDGDAVTYTVVLKDTLAKNISDTTYTLSNLDYNYNQAGKIIAKDPKGLTTEASFTAATKVIVFVKIPDAAFEKLLIDNKIDKDGVINGQMNADDAKGVKVINYNPYYYFIESLAGIEVFTDLEELSCHYYPGGGGFAPDPKKILKALDLSKNVNLKILDCGGYPFGSLDISKNINLQSLICNSNNLTNLDLSKNVNLKYLWCHNNQFAVLDVSKNVALQTLSCWSSQLTNLDVSKNVDLQNLYCYDNQLKTICVADIAKANVNKNWQKDATATYAICK